MLIAHQHQPVFFQTTKRVFINTLQKRQIVVVDDDLDIQDLVTAYFKTKSFQVICFPDAESAVKEAAKTGSNWDVLLTDLNLPGMSGLEITLKLKQMLPNLPIILITTSKSAEAAVEAINKGAYDFIVKPIHFSQLQISVERALHLNSLKGDLNEMREIVKAVTTKNTNIIGRSPNFVAALDVASRVATSRANILISGESGTGKEVFAKFIHNASKSKGGQLVAINCSAIPENLLESELFGHAKGAFTGAHEKRIGLFEQAENGTLFLDEIGDLSLPMQAKILRVLQEKKIKRVGENQDREINCRIISATHKDLSVEVEQKRFREDLFFRLNVIPIVIPPLRERQEDLLPLAETFLKKFVLESGSAPKALSKDAVRFVLENPWRGNVRELENSLERAVALSPGPAILLEHFMPLTGLKAKARAQEAADNVFCLPFASTLPQLEEVIQKYIEFAIEKNLGARDKTAKDIGIDRKTLYKRINPKEVINGQSNN